MAEKSFFFDSEEDENGQPDRPFFSADFAKMFARFFVTGIYPIPSTNLQTFAKNLMLVSVQPGGAFVQGRSYENDEEIEIQINTADSAYNRKDVIVVQLNLIEREIKTLYKAGIANSNPQPPELIRTDDIYELKLAEIFIPAGAATLDNSNIIDTRLNNEVCGLVDNLIKNVDTTTIFNQYQEYLDAKIAEWNTTKEQQATDWQNQMTAQENTFNSEFTTRMTDIDDWYATIKSNISTRQSVTFEDAAYIKGVETLTTFPSTVGAIATSNAYVKSNNKKVADKVVVSLPNGNIQSTVTFYDENEQVLKVVVQTTEFNSEGSIVVPVI